MDPILNSFITALFIFTRQSLSSSQVVLFSMILMINISMLVTIIETRLQNAL